MDRVAKRGISSSGRALAWHVRGDRFDPGILHFKAWSCLNEDQAFLLAIFSFQIRKPAIREIQFLLLQIENQQIVLRFLSQTGLSPSRQK